MTKWNDLSQEEKISELRKDIVRTMETVKSWIAQQQQLGEYHNTLTKKHAETASRLSQALIRIANLEARTK